MALYKNKGSIIQRIKFSDGSKYFINPNGSIESSKKVDFQDKNIVVKEEKKKSSNTKEQKQETESTGE